MSLREHALYRNSRQTMRKTGSSTGWWRSTLCICDATGSYDPDKPESYHVLAERNWQKEIYQTAFSRTIPVSVNGGTGKIYLLRLC